KRRALAFEWQFLQGRARGTAACRRGPTIAGCRPALEGGIYEFVLCRDEKEPDKVQILSRDRESWASLPARGQKVACVSFRQDFVVLACEPAEDAQKPGSITVWDWSATPSRVVSRLDGHRGGTVALALSEDTKQLLSAGADGQVLLRDVATGATL